MQLSENGHNCTSGGISKHEHANHAPEVPFQPLYHQDSSLEKKSEKIINFFNNLENYGPYYCGNYLFRGCEEYNYLFLTDHTCFLCQGQLTCIVFCLQSVSAALTKSSECHRRPTFAKDCSVGQNLSTQITEKKMSSTNLESQLLLLMNDRLLGLVSDLCSN